MALLEIRQLGIAVGGSEIVKNLSLTLDKGQRLALVGAAGTGKSMLALAIAGLLPPSATTTGTIALEGSPVPGSEIERARLRRKGIGIVLQHAGLGLDPMQTIDEQLGGSSAQTRALLDALGIESAKSAGYPRSLSPQDRQLCAIALTLAGNPKVLIADDPFAGLDPLAQRRVVNLFDRLCTEQAMALLLICHDLKAIAALCGKMVVLGQGGVVEAGEKTEVLGHPKHEFTRAMVTAGRVRARTLARAPIGGALVEVRHLTRRYRQPDVSIFEPRPPVVALDDVSLTLREGEALAVVGPSGSGKSTLTRIVAGLERASRGELAFDEDIYHGTDLPTRHRRSIGYVFADPERSFDPRLTVGESIAQPLRLLADEPIEDLGGRIVEIVDAVGMSPDVLERHPHEFSRAEAQRLAIARALIVRPRLVVLDDPVARLDILARGEVLAMLNRLRADYGLSYLIAAHDFEMVRIIADRVIVLDRGKVVEATTPAQMLDRPQHEVTRRLVAAALPDVGIVPVF